MALIYPRHGSERLGIVKVLFNTYIIVGALIHPGRGCKGLGMAEFLFNA